MDIRHIIDKEVIFCFIFLVVLSATAITQENNSSFWLQKGDEFYKNNSYDLALRCYDKAIEIDPENVDVWYNKAVVLKELGRDTEAEKALAKAKVLTTSTAPDASSSKSERIKLVYSGEKSAEYMKTIFVSKEGYDGITIYFILADKNGVSVASDGKMELSITDEDTGRNLFSISSDIKKSDFVDATLGLGLFAHKDVILNIGRIPYSSMKNVPDGEYAKGEVKVKFTTPKNKVLSGKETVYFN
jgi:tetratricopeptide (TPR) repeat protein